jgi:hypothetical protein
VTSPNEPLAGLEFAHLRMVKDVEYLEAELEQLPF